MKINQMPISLIPVLLVRAKVKLGKKIRIKISKKIKTKIKIKIKIKIKSTHHSTIKTGRKNKMQKQVSMSNKIDFNFPNNL